MIDFGVENEFVSFVNHAFEREKHHREIMFLVKTDKKLKLMMIQTNNKSNPFESEWYKAQVHTFKGSIDI